MRGVDDRICYPYWEQYSVHPHMRGVDYPRRPVPYPDIRFIPTCVGSMHDAKVLMILVIGSSPHAWGRCTSDSRLCSRNTVHPHMRGVDGYLKMRTTGRDRFIPTCVGSMPVNG